MISFKHKFIFIHVPKTAGISISDALKEYTEDEISFHKSVFNILNNDGTQGIYMKSSRWKGFEGDYYHHASIDDLYRRLGDEIFSFYIFACVRNPFDRVISQTSFANKINTMPLLLQNFGLPKPQLEYLKINDKVVANRILRFENLQEDFNQACKEIGLPELDLGHKNRSNRTDYRNYYTEQTKNMIYRMYKDEFDYFGYEF
jgi:hypothetical protein